MLASEKLMRKRAAEIIGDNLTLEKVALTFSLKEGGEEVRLRPYGYIPDIWAQVVQLLENNDRCRVTKLSDHQLKQSLQEWNVMLAWWQNPRG